MSSLSYSVWMIALLIYCIFCPVPEDLSLFFQHNNYVLQFPTWTKTNKHAHLQKKKLPVFSKLKIQAVMFSKWLWERYEREDGRSVGPRPEVRREIREITVKEHLVLWSPF